MANNMLRCIRANLPPMIGNGPVKGTQKMIPSKKMTMINTDRNISTSAYFSNTKSTFHNFFEGEKVTKAFAKKFEAVELKPYLIKLDYKTPSKSIYSWLQFAVLLALCMSVWFDITITGVKKDEK